ncbi:igE-binding protein-like [Manis pentadactyla]|uniref:igE-binding protein-like n=1 Tax=Manis pentadactyla TaxID=143292 RepID=UPI00255CA972|nr:igE-binding protein-like [Manis pentadactyla]
MGNAPSLVTALQTALKERNLKVSSKVLGSFVKEVDRVAPWFICSGSLSIPSWDKLGKDLDREEEEGHLRGGTRPLWKLIRACLQDEKCEKVIKAGQRALTEIQESMSETERETELARGRKRTAKMKVKKPQSEGESPPRAKVKEPRGAGDDHLGESSKYPWEELRELQLSDREPEEELISSEEGGETRTVKCGSERTSKAERQTKEKMKGCSPSPTAPPPYVSGTHTFCHPDTIQAIKQMFPVFEDNGVRSHQPLSHKQVKDLAESVRAYGVSANYTLAQIERLTETAMTPTDWQYVTKACLTSMGQYIEWKALWHDISMTQARANAAEGQPVWSYDMLTGQGQWVANQTAFPTQVYAQINACAAKAWKALTNKGEVSGNLTKIIQGPSEPFSDFVARMMEAVGRVFGDQEQAMPLVEQLVFEQCTKECRQAITPWKQKGMHAWLKACREIGGPLTNAGLAAAILQSHKQARITNKNIKCFH